MITEILKLLKWTELEYNQFIYDNGVAYLQQYIPSDEQGIAALERSRIYWNWWRNHWYQRDYQFMRKVNRSAPLEGIREYYRHFNNPKKLAAGIWPNAVVLNESYARMIGEYNKNLRHAS